ncbi:glycoside hydrolase family 5 protein [Colletotrichum plurivorum]|uniref:Glycoside hydrolase family 5 protein n=1 Tax=Colletotrichum plurivorum TaxID=2175906 RepID=A0A8H6NF44_9PEZI|nr:glycoside hydrolase family 5 protein [Colletotrichum plurivorum]
MGWGCLRATRIVEPSLISFNRRREAAFKTTLPNYFRGFLEAVTIDSILHNDPSDVCRIMSSTAHYHAIHAGGAGHDPAVHGIGSHDDTYRDANSGDGPDGHAFRTPASMSKEGNEDTAEASTLDAGFLHQESVVLKVLSWAWDVILTVLPLFFIVLAILATKLNGMPVATSDYGDKVVEITRLGPTIYPILFAMVAARFYKNAARYRLERPGGMRLSTLEQIFGSQSFASALERLIVVRAQLILGALILLTWAMSPLGGQSSTRLLGTRERVLESSSPVYYDNRLYKSSVWDDPDLYELSASDIVQALYSGSLLSPKKQQQAFSDLWERPKIPQLPRNWKHADNGEDWRRIDSEALRAGSEPFSSLIGLNFQSPDFSDNTTRYEFDVHSSYFDFECRKILHTNSDDETGKITFWQALATGRRVFTNLTAAVPRYAPSYQSFVPTLAYPWQNSTAPFMLYTSFMTTKATRGGLYMTVFNCTMATPHVETKMGCTAQGCSPLEQRRVIDDKEELLGMPIALFQYVVKTALDAWPNMTKVVLIKASATENFIANDESVYANQNLRNWTKVDEEMFSSRLTTAFNTAWESGVDSYNITKGSSFAESTTSPADSWSNQTLAFVTRNENVYYVNVVWAAILIFATTVLQALAVGGLVLRCLIRGPDILGFASALTRDNRFVPVNGGSALDGADRAKSLGHMRIRIADVQPQESCGYVAFSIIPNDGGTKEGEPLSINRIQATPPSTAMMGQFLLTKSIFTTTLCPLQGPVFAGLSVHALRHPTRLTDQADARPPTEPNMSPPLTTAANYAANDLSDAALGGPIALEDGLFVDGYGRALSLHGLNISGASKLPTTPNGLSHLTEGFFEHRTVTFVGRPFPLEDAPLHFRRLQAWGLPLVRLLVTWESIGHAGPDPRTDLDLEYIEYLRKLIEMMPAYGIKCFVCAHQDVWSRFSGGSGAPGWTFEVAGLDVEAFTETGAAYVHGQDELRRASAPVNEKEPSGPFVWPSGYQKLAASTMATLFWAGDALAPKLQCCRTGKDGEEESVSVQEFLQDALIEAFGRLADEVAGLEACIGFEPMNEPHRGLINLHGFHGWNYDTDLHIGHYPSLKQALALASGYAQEIDYYVKSWPFPTRVSHKSVVEPKGRSAWLSSKEKNHGLGECVWRAHGAWEWDDAKKSAKVLQEDYFEVDHQPGREGRPIEWYRDFYAPFLKRFSERVSRKSSRQFCFIEPIPNEFMPPWVEKDSKEATAAQKQKYATKTVIDSPRPSNLVFAPHFYDLNVLFSKHHSWMSVNVQGLSRGMFILKALYFGARALRKNYRLQISNILKYGKASLGSHVPAVIGEVGIPFDIEGGEAFATGRYDKQRELMHALISAMEDNQVNFTLWNYNPDNRVEYGDGWNREDFSVINGDEKEVPGRIMQDYTNEAHAQDELFRGGRVLDVIIRPYAVKIAGRPLRSDWDPRTLRYEFEWTSQDRVGEKQSDKRRTTEVFIPRYHYADGIQVKLSDGDWSYDAGLQTLYVRHKAEVYRHRLVVEIPNVGKRLLERVERRRRAVPPRFPLSLVSANTELAIEELDKGLILVMLLLPAIAAALAIFAQSLQ